MIELLLLAIEEVELPPDLWTHQNKEWSKTLKMARDYGWCEPRETSNHPKIILDCPQSSPQCRITIFSTGRGTENVARSARNKIRNCTHRMGVEREIGEIRRKLDTAERLINAVSLLIDQKQAQQNVMELLAEVERCIDEVEEQLLTASYVEESDRYDQIMGQVATYENDLVEYADLATEAQVTAVLDDVRITVRSVELSVGQEIPRKHPDFECIMADVRLIKERYETQRSRIK